MKRALIIALALIVLAAFSACTDITDPKLVKELHSTYLDSGKIMVLNGQWYDLELNLSLPQDRSYQDVSFSGTTVSDTEGNKFLRLRSSNPPNPFEYSLSADVTTSQRRTISLPSSYNISGSMLDYLEETDKAQSNNPAIKQLAEKLTENCSTDFERISRLAVWVSENVNYDLSLVNQDKDALWVLENKKGVCLEHSNLFTALTRSLGYPTRYLLGKAYGSYGWMGHSWNEVYIGEWVPVDPTWLEVGHLDATHIEFYRSPFGTLSNDVRANASESSQIEWPREQAFFGKSNNESGIIEESVTLDEPFDDYVLGVGSETLGLGEQTVVYLQMTGREYKVVEATLVSCSSVSDVITVEKPTQYLVLEPGKQAVASWVIQAGTSLQEGVIYTCPMSLASNRLNEKTLSIKVRSDHSSPKLSLNIEKPLLSLGNQQTATAAVEGSNADVWLISGDLMEKASPSGGKAYFAFTPTQLGENQALVFSSDGGVKTERFTVKEKSELSILEVNAPAETMQGYNFTVNLTLENKQEPEQVKLKVSFGEQSQTESIELAGTETLSFEFTALETGKQLLQVSLSDGTTDEALNSIQIYQAAEVSISTVRFVESEGKYLSEIVFSASPTVKNLRVSIGNQAVNESSVQLAPGKHDLTLEWEDVLGNHYSQTSSVEIPAAPNELTLNSFIKAIGKAWFILAIIFVCFIFVVIITVLAVTGHLKETMRKPRRL